MSKSKFNKTDMASAQAGLEATTGSNSLWKPAAGVHYVRILPGVGNMEIKGRPAFYSGFPLHWNLGNGAPIPCPRRMGLSPTCPICIHINKLPEKEARKMWANWSFYTNILLMDANDTPLLGADEEPQVKIWRVGRETLSKIMAAAERESDSVNDLIDITDIQEGWTLRAKRTAGERVEDTTWDISCVKSGPSNISDFLDLIDLDTIPDLSSFVQFLEPEEMIAALTMSTVDPFAVVPEAKRLPRGRDDDDDDEDEAKPVVSGQARLKELMEKAKAKKAKS